jgi:hypothetical protein
MTLINTVISILNINCGTVTCAYPTEIETLFYLVFFPTVFLILFIYILTNFIFRNSGSGTKGLRLLISIGVYAFIIFEDFFTLVVSVSRLWWLLTIFLVGLYAFVRHLFRGGEGGGGRGTLSGVGTGQIRGLIKKMKKEHIDNPVEGMLGLESSDHKVKRISAIKLRKMLEKVNYDVAKLSKDQKTVYKELCRLAGFDALTLFTGKNKGDVKKEIDQAAE